MRLYHIMIAPHNSKFDFIQIGCMQKTIFQTAVPVRSIGKKIPVKNKTVYTVIRGCIDFLFHHSQVGFILVSPQGDFGLLMSGKTWCGMFDQIPFGPAFTMSFFIARINVPVWEIVG